jgi:hypothetical protein
LFIALFVPVQGINREIIIASIRHYLGGDALVRPANYEVCHSKLILYSYSQTDIRISESQKGGGSPAGGFHNFERDTYNGGWLIKLLVIEVWCGGIENHCGSQGWFGEVGDGGGWAGGWAKESSFEGTPRQLASWYVYFLETKRVSLMSTGNIYNPSYSQEQDLFRSTKMWGALCRGTLNSQLWFRPKLGFFYLRP